MREKEIEQKLVKAVKNGGGTVLSLYRLVLMVCQTALSYCRMVSLPL